MRSTLPNLLAAFLLAYLAAPALAEAPSHFGLRAGVNLSAFTGEFGDIVHPDSRVAANVAFVYEYDFLPELSFHGELGYSGKGGVSHSEGTDPVGNPTGTFADTWSFEYLELPLFLRGRMPAFGTSHVFAEAGPLFDFRLSGKFSSEAPGFPDVSITTRMNAVDVGFGAGLGIEFPAGPGRLGIESRYTRGFSDLYEVSGTLSTINQAWTFALSYTR